MLLLRRLDADMGESLIRLERRPREGASLKGLIEELACGPDWERLPEAS